MPFFLIRHNFSDNSPPDVFCDQPIAKLKEFYRNEFEKYYPFNVDVGFELNMTDSWIPIKLIKVKSDVERKPNEDANDIEEAMEENIIEQKSVFQLIDEELSKNNLVIVSGCNVGIYMSIPNYYLQAYQDPVKQY